MDIMDPEMQAHYAELFPIAFGSEEETMMMSGKPDDWYGQYEEPKAFVSNFSDYLPKGIRTAPEGYRLYLQNGQLMYSTGVGGTILERATPECSTTAEYVTSVQASEQLLVKMGMNYVRERAIIGDPVALRVQRRVADAAGHTRACHDNFELRNPSWLSGFQRNGAEQLLMGHLATRSFITGAGYVTPNGLRFAQKAEHTRSLSNYGFVNSAYRTTAELNTGPRIEIRCNDINISPWATRVRIGTSALYLTALQTPLGDGFWKFLPQMCKDRTGLVENLQLFNKAHMDNDGRLKSSKNLIKAVDFQQHIYNTMAESLDTYVDISDEYRELLEEGIQYCDDFRSVLKGETELEDLRDRSDVGAKFSKIAASVSKGREDGYSRSAHDLISMAWDMRYDLIEIKPGLKGQPRVEFGYGYRFRDNNGFKGTTPQADIDRAEYYPPETTRAFLRGNLIRKGYAAACNWASVKIQSEFGELDELNKKRVGLGTKVVLDALMKSDDIINYVKNKRPLPEANPVTDPPSIFPPLY